MIALPEMIYSRCRFIKVSPGSKNAFEPDWQKTKNYKWSSPELKDHIRQSVNYGIMPGGGICQLDVDAPDVWERLGVLDHFKNTYRVQRGPRCHLYIICKDAPPEKFVFYDPETYDPKNPKNNKSVGDMRGSDSPFYVMGPGSVHPSGEIYEQKNENDIQIFSWSELQTILSPFILARENEPKPEPIIRTVIPDDGKFKKSSITNAYGLMVEDFLYPDNPIKRGDEIQGSHPIHGSETGMNLQINTSKGVWHCYRDNTGGDAAMAAAVKYGLIQCHEARPGALTKELSRQLVGELEKHGYENRTSPSKLPGAAQKAPVVNPPPEQPPIPTNIIDRAWSIINSGEAYEFMLKTIKRGYVGGESEIRLHLASIGSQMCGNSEGGLTPNMTGDTGTGKTTLQRTILHHLSPKYKSDGARTQKAIYYADYRPGTVVFFDNLDEMDEILTGIMNMRTMYFQEKQPYEVTEMKTKTTVNRGLNQRVMLWINGRDAAFEDAALSRQLVLATEVGKDHAEKLKEFQLKRLREGTPAFKVDDDVLTCRAIHEILMDESEKDPVTIVLDRLDDININDPRGRTQAGDAIKGIAAWKRHARQAREDGSISAEPDDYAEVTKIFKSNLTSKCSKQELKVLKAMMNHPQGITQKKICEITELPQTTISFCIEGRGGQGGLINKLGGVVYADDTYIQDEADSSMIDGKFKKAGRRAKVYAISSPEKIGIDKTGQVTLTGTAAGDIIVWH